MVYMRHIAIKLLYKKKQGAPTFKKRARREKAKEEERKKGRIANEDKKEERGKPVAVTSELSGKMGWFMLQLMLLKVPSRSVEESDKQYTDQLRHECWLWEANVMLSSPAMEKWELRGREARKGFAYLDCWRFPIGQACWEVEGGLSPIGVLTLVPHSQQNVEFLGVAHYQGMQAVGTMRQQQWGSQGCPGASVSWWKGDTGTAKKDNRWMQCTVPLKKLLCTGSLGQKNQPPHHGATWSRDEEKQLTC